MQNSTNTAAARRIRRLLGHHHLSAQRVVNYELDEDEEVLKKKLGEATEEELLDIIRRSESSAPLLCRAAADRLLDVWANEQGHIAKEELLEAERVQQDDLRMAKQLFDGLNERFPEWAEAWSRRAALSLALNEHEESIRLSMQCLKYKPAHFGSLTRLVLCYLELGLAQEANDAAEVLSGVLPEEGKGYLQLIASRLPPPSESSNNALMRGEKVIYTDGDVW